MSSLLDAQLRVITAAKSWRYHTQYGAPHYTSAASEVQEKNAVRRELIKAVDALKQLTDHEGKET
jgi:hypothetical protein